MADLKTDVRYIKGIGEQRAKALGKLGIHTLRDLISWFPGGMRTGPKPAASRTWSPANPPASPPWSPRPPRCPTFARAWTW